MRICLVVALAAMVFASVSFAEEPAAAPASPSMTQVESTLIKEVGYNPATQILTVTFVNQEGVYEYQKVPEAVYKELMAAVAIGQQQIAEMKPKATYYDVVLKCRDAVNISVIAKDYGWSAMRMNEYLHEKGIQFKQGDIWLLYQKYAPNGYTKTNTHIYEDSKGIQHTKVHTK